ncbi:hypothetical protein TNCV_4747401, partial [Trichonephila clavipes]
MEVVFPPNRSHDDRMASGRKRGERGHHVTYFISVKKLEDCPPLRLLNPIFRLGDPFPPDPGTCINS